jgi:hypothetical protein
MNITIDNIILIGSILLFISIFADLEKSGMIFNGA